MSYTPLSHVATGELATASLHNTLLDNVAGLITGLHELTIPMTAFRPHLSGGCGPIEDVLLSSGKYVTGMPFDGTSVEAAYFWFALPKRWNEGTITFQVYWFNTAGGSGAVVWRMSAVAMGDDETMDTALGTAQAVTDTALAANKLAVSSQSAAITIGGSPQFGDDIHFLLERVPTDASDTYTNDAYVSKIKLRLTVDASEDA